MISRKLLVLFLLFGYSFTIVGENVYAQRSKKSNSSRGNKSRSKSKKSSRSGSSARGDHSSSSANYEEENAVPVQTSTTYTETTTTTVQQVAPTPVQQSLVVDEAEEEVETTKSSSGVADMSTDPEWEDFRICMQQNCAGGDEQPLNVECYKTLNFENAFSVCKDYLSDESKIKDFKKYFSGPFIKQEKKAFCEGEIWKGKFNEANGRCAITVTFNRNKVDAKHHGCSRVSKTKTWYLDNKNYICDGEAVFGVSPCYHDSANAEAAKTQKITAGITLAMGAITGVAAAFATTRNYKEKGNDEYARNEDGSLKYDNEGKAIKIEAETKTWSKDADKEFKKNALTTGIMDGLAASSGSLATGGTQLASAILSEKERGQREYGRCELPNGTMINEGNSIKLSW